MLALLSRARRRGLSARILEASGRRPLPGRLQRVGLQPLNDRCAENLPVVEHVAALLAADAQCADRYFGGRALSGGRTVAQGMGSIDAVDQREAAKAATRQTGSDAGWRPRAPFSQAFRNADDPARLQAELTAGSSS